MQLSGRWVGLLLVASALAACDKLPTNLDGDSTSSGADAVLQCSVDTDCMINRVCDGGQCKVHEHGEVGTNRTVTVPSNTANETVAIPQPNIQVPIQEVLASFPCSDLKIDAVDEDKGSIKVSGYVSRADDVSAVKQRIDGIEGVKSSTADVQLRIWPHCEVVKLLEPYKARNGDSGYGLTIMPSTGHSDRFIESENVIAKLVQANYDGYVYVDYFTVSGQVAHMYPNIGEPNSGRLIRSSEQFEVGATPSKTWTVAPPFGQELITVISSPTPLYPEPLPEIQTAEEYLPRMRQMFEANKRNAKLAATYLFIQTGPEL
ncbi:MAG: DUF4384 domain-containing protein [Thermomonas sp.]|uniref:DUF4384 domain-containing protein n=1 Tax=Thermomonas sp. TaxID=1971895 RepID=UPI001B5DE650|nr:DUF4384 domain-containing protein [Thermomonas sp.]MBP8647662.1 DUF4384 domain-containing protein [Thermomonas sp.]